MDDTQIMFSLSISPEIYDKDVNKEFWVKEHKLLCLFPSWVKVDATGFFILDKNKYNCSYSVSPDGTSPERKQPWPVSAKQQWGVMSTNSLGNVMK